MPPAPPRSLIVTIYGLYAREVGCWLSVSSLIQLLAELGVEEPAVRSSISRLKRRGILVAQRQGGRAGYALSAHARSILDEGDQRIFAATRASLADGWVMAVFSVPEAQRQQRHRLRSRLTWLGFGAVSSGVWIAPKRLLAPTQEALARDELLAYVDLFESDYVGPEDLREEVARWWDLDALGALYTDFHREFAPIAQRRRGTRTGDAFADYVRALTTWRRLPYLDPGLPEELLPPDWAGTLAQATFSTLHKRLAAPAHRFVDTVRESES